MAKSDKVDLPNESSDFDSIFWIYVTFHLAEFSCSKYSFLLNATAHQRRSCEVGWGEILKRCPKKFVEEFSEEQFVIDETEKCLITRRFHSIRRTTISSEKIWECRQPINPLSVWSSRSSIVWSKRPSTSRFHATILLRARLACQRSTSAWLARRRYKSSSFSLRVPKRRPKIERGRIATCSEVTGCRGCVLLPSSQE